MKQRIPLPESKKKRNGIADLPGTLVAERRVLARRLVALKQMKKGRLQKLLTGKVGVNLPGRSA